MTISYIGTTVLSNAAFLIRLFAFVGSRAGCLAATNDAAADVIDHNMVNSSSSPRNGVNGSLSVFRSQIYLVLNAPVGILSLQFGSCFLLPTCAVNLLLDALQTQGYRTYLT